MNIVYIIQHNLYQYVPHKAVAEVSKIASYRRLVAVSHGWQSKSIDGCCSCNDSCDVLVVPVVVVVQ